MQLQLLYQQILCSKDSMPLFYYYTPQQEKQSNTVQKNSRISICTKIDKQIQTQYKPSNFSIYNFDESQDKDTKLKYQLHQLIEKQDISEIHDQSPENTHIFKPFGFYCLPSMSIYIRDCCFEVICAKFQRINSFKSSILLIPYQQGLPSYINLLLENNKQKITQICLKQKFDSSQKVTQMVMTYLQTIKNPFYQKITVLCSSFDDFIKISDLIRILMLKFDGKKQLTL